MTSLAVPQMPPRAATNALRALVVDDHPRIREPLALFLRREGLAVDTAGDLRAMFGLLRMRRFDIVVLDVMLPDGDGRQACARVQAEHGVPVILLTAMGAVDDRVRGLEGGADDYVVKPFEPRELLARMRGAVRRRAPVAGRAAGMAPAADAAPAPQEPPPRRYAFDGWRFDAARAQLEPPPGQGAAPQRLSEAEARLLEVLLGHANTVLSRDQLLDLTRTQGRQGDAAFDRTIDRQISRLRRKLQDGGPAQACALRTVRGGGYMLVAARVERPHG